MCTLALQACLVYGVGFGGIGAMLSLLVIDTFGAAHFGKIMGGIQTGVVRLLRRLPLPRISLGSDLALRCVQAIPSITAPILGGAVFDATGSYRIHFGITLPIFAVAMVLLMSGGPAVGKRGPRKR